MESNNNDFLVQTAKDYGLSLAEVTRVYLQNNSLIHFYEKLEELLKAKQK